MNQTLSRVLSWVLALVVGAVYGTAGTIAHAYRLGPIPVGLILAVIGIAALFVALRALTGDRWTALCGGVGALAATVVFSGSGPGGDVVVPGGDLDLLAGVNLGLAWGIAVGLAATIVVAWPDLRAASSRTDN
ncbi:DUF6113 family protein [Microbacterium elymi]|uniref:DUF6113 family protein n=1 Tax=Microbacterium elymi TaxID=2909587 RepID=A0ABY5NK50_9MICO|nr:MULTISPECIES: DUF6113 family protein [Microbacterium]UUT35528.1 DUF6113 family protein [Microbacterium elymi]